MGGLQVFDRSEPLHIRLDTGAQMLREDDMVRRVGGVYQLGQLAQDYPDKYHIQIMKMLCIFVRQLDADEEEGSKGSGSVDGKENQPRADIQEALTVIGKRSEIGRALEKKDGYKLDLQASDLKKMILEEAHLADADLAGADLTEARLVRADLTGADLVGAELVRADLTGADLADAELARADLTGADLTGARGLNQGQLSKAVVQEEGTPPELDKEIQVKWNIVGSMPPAIERPATEMTGTTTLYSKQPPAADLPIAYLSGADFSGKNLSSKDLSGKDMTVAELLLTNLSGADLSGADLSGADLSGADLSGADLKDAELTDVTLLLANLSGADLSGADLSGADLSGAKLSDTDLSGINLARTDLSGINLTYINLSGADLTGANLTGTVLIKVQGLTQEQLDATVISEKGDPPKLYAAKDSETGKQLVWRGETIPEDGAK